jgi:predicted transcriptional regulator
MAVHIKPETELRLNELAEQSGRATDELAEDAIAAYLEGVAELRNALDQRYDDFKSGKVEAIDGEAFFERLRERGAERLGGDPRNER